MTFVGIDPSSPHKMTFLAADVGKTVFYIGVWTKSLDSQGGEDDGPISEYASGTITG